MSLSPRASLERQREVLHQDIARAAAASDTRAVLAKSERLRVIDQILEEYAALDVRARKILSNGSERTDAPPSTEIPLRVPGRAHGARIREEFVRQADARGVTFQPYRGAVMRTGSGLRVGIAVATERQPNRWFLGLPEDGIDAAVLLCQDDSGKTVDICLPKDFFADYGKYLSRSGGQVKFNVVRSGSHYSLSVPQRGQVPVDQYIGAIQKVIR